MARKSLGFVPLIWQCDSCGTQNPGPVKTCTSCGAPQPTDVEFLRVDEEKFNFIKDEALIREAKAGPNIHCPFCGTRNPASAKLCSNCGGELTMGGKAREAGQKVRTKAEAEQRLPVDVPKPKKKRSRSFTIFAIIAGLVVITGCIVLLMLLLNTDAVTATVTDVAWERAIAVEEYTTVTRNDWLDEIPANADVGSCTLSYRYTSEQEQPNATEVCSEAEYIDTGTGLAEKVVECVYEIWDDYCEYTVLDWVLVENVTTSGDDLNPYWPDPNLSSEQRFGEQSESYVIIFSGDGETYRYSTSDVNLFLEAQTGSRWRLEVNQLGGVQSIEPAN